MKQNVWCKFLNLHKYEIIKEEPMRDKKSYEIGKVIISRCTNCGKLRQTVIYTEEGYGKY